MSKTNITYKEIPRTQITPSKTNPRKYFDPAYLKELAASISEKGIVQPLTVRPKGKAYELVIGECRWRSAALAELDLLPCTVRELTDQQAFEIQIIENLHRQDLKPLEEAAAFRALITGSPDKHSAESIAARVGKSPSWVWDMMKLLDLIPEARKLLDSGRISVNHAIPIARLTPAQQKALIDPDSGGLFQGERYTLELDGPETKPADKYADVKPVSVKELQAYIAEHIRFDPRKAAAAAPMLFENVAARVDEANKREGRGAKVIAITHNHHVNDDAKAKDGERTFGPRTWRRADGTKASQADPKHYGKFVDAPKCENSVLGVIVAGPEYGQAFDVCIAREKCKIHWPAEVKAKAQREKAKQAATPAGKSGNANKSATTATKAAAEAAKKAAAEAAEKEAEAAFELIRTATLEAANQMPAKLPEPVFAHMLEVLNDQLNTRARLTDKKLGVTQANFARKLAGLLAIDDCDEAGIDWPQQLEGWAKVLGVDIEALRAQAKKELQTSGVDQQQPKVKVRKKAA